MDTLIPKNIKGKKYDLYEFVNASTEENAKNCFDRACARLTNPFNWHTIANLPVKFLPSDKDGYSITLPLREGRFFRLDISGPVSSSVSGYDWIKADAVQSKRNPESQDESFGITLRACSNPYNGSSATPNFFKSLATSSFVIKRTKNIVTASYHGRNELPYTIPRKIPENIRNASVALGAEAGFSELVWAGLLKALLE